MTFYEIYFHADASGGRTTGSRASQFGMNSEAVRELPTCRLGRAREIQGPIVNVENAISILVPVLVLAVLWTVVRHWILPFVLGFALAVALGPSARPMLASAWDAIANVGDAIFRGGSRGEDASERFPERREPNSGRYYDQERR